jgi:zinc and cadmium transporter
VGLLVLSINQKFLSRITFFLVAVAAGALMGDAFIHLIPESLESSSNITLTMLMIIGGILTFFILEKYLHFHHEHDECRHENEIKPVGPLILISDGIHNILDGMIIGISYLVSLPVGIATTIAVIFHEIPQEVGDFGVLLHAGYSKSRALFYNFLSALGAIIGLGIVLILPPLSRENLSLLLSFAAGTFIYIAMVDLVPELHKQKRPLGTVIEFLGILFGIGLMYALLFIE